MFKMLDMKSFGLQLRSIREELNFTRKRVEEITGINKETLRKIERGDVVPQLVTLQLLSVEYRVDLINLFSKFQDVNPISNAYKLTDDILVNAYSDENLQSFLISEDNIQSCNLVDPKEVSQFNTFINALTLSNSSKVNDKKKAIELLIKNIDNIETAYDLKESSPQLNFLELRLLFVCGVTYAEISDFHISNIIFGYLKNEILKSIHQSEYTLQLMLKLLCNIAYNHHSIDEHDKALLVVQEGIDFCNNYNSNYLLEVFIYRKAVSQYYQGINDYNKTFNQAFTILEIKGNIEQLERYKKITKDKYGV